MTWDQVSKTSSEAPLLPAGDATVTGHLIRRLELFAKIAEGPEIITIPKLMYMSRHGVDEEANGARRATGGPSSYARAARIMIGRWKSRP